MKWIYMKIRSLAIIFIKLLLILYTVTMMLKIYIINFLNVVVSTI